MQVLDTQTGSRQGAPYKARKRKRSPSDARREDRRLQERIARNAANIDAVAAQRQQAWAQASTATALRAVDRTPREMVARETVAVTDRDPDLMVIGEELDQLYEEKRRLESGRNAVGDGDARTDEKAQRELIEPMRQDDLRARRR